MFTLGECYMYNNEQLNSPIHCYKRCSFICRDLQNHKSFVCLFSHQYRIQKFNLFSACYSIDTRRQQGKKDNQAHCMIARLVCRFYLVSGRCTIDSGMWHSWWNFETNVQLFQAPAGIKNGLTFALCGFHPALMPNLHTQSEQRLS